MRTMVAFAAFALFAAAVSAVPAMAADSEAEYLLFANTSSHPFRVRGMTVGGKTCASCADRTIGPGTVVMVKVGPLGANHLKLTITGSGTCNYDISSDGSSRTGNCGTSPAISDARDVHDQMLFDTAGTPVFTLFYAYEPPKH